MPKKRSEQIATLEEIVKLLQKAALSAAQSSFLHNIGPGGIALSLTESVVQALILLRNHLDDFVRLRGGKPVERLSSESVTADPIVQDMLLLMETIPVHTDEGKCQVLLMHVQLLENCAVQFAIAVDKAGGIRAFEELANTISVPAVVVDGIIETLNALHDTIIGDRVLEYCNHKPPYLAEVVESVLYPAGSA